MSGTDKMTLPPIDDDEVSGWEEVSGVHARYSKSGTLIAIEVTGNRHRIRKLIRGTWQGLTLREKTRVILFLSHAFGAVLALGHYLPALYRMVTHAR